MLEYTLTQTNTSVSGSNIFYCIDTTNTCTPNVKYTDKIYSKNNGTYYFRYQVTSGAGKSSSGSYTATVNDTTYCAVNLIKNGSFENGIDGWGNFNPTDHYIHAWNASNPKYGSFVFRIVTLSNIQLFARTYVNANSLQGHKVYGKVSAYKDQASTDPGLYLSFGQTDELWPSVGANYSSWYRYYTTDYNKWVDISLYIDNAPYNYLNAMLSQSNTVNVINTSIYFDGLIIIDLTDTFGAGNEPDKEWCDHNLSWFEERKIVYK